MIWVAFYRNIQMTFWTDTKIADEFTPEDRYFYLYLFTNPHTNLAGCYEIGIKQIANEIGYKAELVKNLLNRFEKVHGVARYSNETKEVLLLNWYKYNWTTSEKFRKPLLKEIQSVKNKDFQTYLLGLFNGEETILNPVETSYEDIVETNTVTNSFSTEIKEIIDYLNSKTGKSYTGKTKAHREHIIARLKDGFSVEDFKKVIDNQVNAWGSDEKMKTYIRPETLFCGKFETYLNNIESDRHKKDREVQEINEQQRKQYDDETAHFFE